MKVNLVYCSDDEGVDDDDEDEEDDEDEVRENYPFHPANLLQFVDETSNII